MCWLLAGIKRPMWSSISNLFLMSHRLRYQIPDLLSGNTLVTIT